MRFPRALVAILALGPITPHAAPADDPEPPARLAMTPAVACRKINGYGDFEPLDEPVLTRHDKLLVYYEPSGFAHDRDGKEYRVHLVQDGRIRRRGEQAIILGKDKFLDYVGKSKTPPLGVYLSNSIALKNLQPGDYDLEIILHDPIGKGRTARQVLKFRVKPVEPTPDGP